MHTRNIWVFFKKTFVPSRDWLVPMSAGGVQRKCELVALIVGSGNGNNQNVDDPRSRGVARSTKCMRSLGATRNRNLNICITVFHLFLIYFIPDFQNKESKFVILFTTLLGKTLKEPKA